MKQAMFTQSLSDFGLKIGDDGKLVRLDGRCIKKYPAFDDWLHRLKPGERLPRGRYFRNKKPGLPFFIIDEFHTHHSVDTFTRPLQNLVCNYPHKISEFT
ncbi:hypothetical protein EA537_23605 [Salmonella enterica]|uniref:hypothetical protein n=1 Tax=Salmonella enterica TaxID=28901 RepID=UPI0008FC2092|nr:hypothetical protein [Salmonella enterica]EAN3270113.1 hypothetical protein [Salmonella enterica subsp. enterica serovar Oranienburg]OIV01263.1 hypothetical protein APP79_23835 [Salmonella enterica subsp. enterica serovar Pomona]